MDQKKEETNQKAIDHLLEYISKVTPHLDEFFQQQLEEAKKISPIAEDMVQRYADFIGGKRMRGALTKLGYDLFGGEENADIYKASGIVEVIQGLALMHDDVMDEDEIRRKNPTLHIQYENLFQKNFASSKRNKKLFGTSMAINVGDLGPFYGNLLIENTNFSAEIKMAFLKRLSEVVIQTVHGQGMDVTYELESVPLEERVMKIHEYKTGYYTVPGPLQYGAILAGASLDDPRYIALEKYGLPIGIAFQLRDDELGMFGEQQELGKPIFSDLKQGKNTLLFAKAFENANEEQMKILEDTHGNPDVSDEDLVRVNKILEETGATKYSQEVSAELVEKGKQYIEQITDDTTQQELLNIIADFVVTRDK